MGFIADGLLWDQEKFKEIDRRAKEQKKITDYTDG
jgi:hypothetical protein